ncbi:alpha-(1,3)-fucosyltransferase B-like [Pectinophora gossypiella]|uniref:alpha-(1,3)-fucosyltransferase B-like n=1 Tax=Pectinophora gossypiella TaxID=13191 RepID=UPI00214F1A3B|nr:alpha-(1,3)-fucosyltransferase B-like [Pectinophora gossypiella]
MYKVDKEALTNQTQSKIDQQAKKDVRIILCSIVIIIAFTVFFAQVIEPYIVNGPSSSVHQHPSSISDKFSVNYVPGYPSIVWYTRNPSYFPEKQPLSCSNGSRVFKCGVYPPETAPEHPEAYLFYGPDVARFPLPRDSETIWALFHEESPRSRPMFFYEKGLNLFNLSATFSRYSDLPLSLYWARGLANITSLDYFVGTTTKNDLLNEISPVIYMQSDCFTITERDAYVEKLMDYIQIDSYGICLHNKDFLFGNASSYLGYLYNDDLLRFIARYKFIIAIENAVCNDYVTEKFWRAIELGVVPIYYGSPLIRDWLPNSKSAILLEDFPTPKLLSEHLHYLLDNDTAYEEHLEHKTLGRISNQNLIDESLTRSYEIEEGGDERFICLICERIHDRNKSRVNVVTKAHYDCPKPKSALTQSVNMYNLWLELINYAEEKIDQIYKEIEDANRTRRSSNTSWDWNT